VRRAPVGAVGEAAVGWDPERHLGSRRQRRILGLDRRGAWVIRRDAIPGGRDLACRASAAVIDPCHPPAGPTATGERMPAAEFASASPAIRTCPRAGPASQLQTRVPAGAQQACPGSR
jgi:hypothetical protein